MKNKKINALTCISGYCDSHILKEFNIFAIKDNQKTIYTNEITNRIVTVPFLSLLLKEKSVNFNLTSIEKVYLYPNHHFHPFKEKSEQLLQMINDHKSHESIVGFLKNIIIFSSVHYHLILTLIKVNKSFPKRILSTWIGQNFKVLFPQMKTFPSVPSTIINISQITFTITSNWLVMQRVFSFILQME